MGCPAKKVCNVWAGSALLQDEALVARILEAVVQAVDVPVTLKIRTGWNRDNRNGVRIAKIAEDAGIAALAVHGRTRADLYEGEAEYDDDRGDQAGDPHSGVRERRRRFAAEGAARARLRRSATR